MYYIYLYIHFRWMGRCQMTSSAVTNLDTYELQWTAPNKSGVYVGFVSPCETSSFILKFNLEGVLEKTRKFDCLVFDCICDNDNLYLLSQEVSQICDF